MKKEENRRWKIAALFQVSKMKENYKLKDLCLVLRGSSASLRPDNERAGGLVVSQPAKTRHPNMAAEENIGGQRWLTLTHYIHVSPVESPSINHSLSSHLDYHQVATLYSLKGER